MTKALHWNFLAAINPTSFKLCVMITPIDDYQFISVLMTMASCQGHSDTGMVKLKVVYSLVLIGLSLNCV